MARDYGIDYSGIGATCNRDSETGIRYGVIPVNSGIMQAWCDSSEADYGAPTCPKCGNECFEWDSDKHDTYDGEGSDYACDGCEYSFMSDEAWPMDGSTLDDGEYKAFEDSSGDVWCVLSPYYTHAQFCSPCAPGACYLLSPVDKGGPRAYCFSHDWFEEGQAPYPVYRVADGTLVKPEDA